MSHSLEDMRAAKQALSGRYLQRFLEAPEMAVFATRSVAAAMTQASHNVHAVGIGLKVVEGKPTSALSILMYVTNKLPESMLAPIDRLPETIDGVPVDVIESPPAMIVAGRARKRKPAGRSPRPPKAAATQACSTRRRERQRPVMGGISAAHHTVTAGTISCFCRSTRSADGAAVFALSNNHVFADVNKAKIGSDLYQPGPMDGGTPNDRLATLERFVRIVLGPDGSNKVDGAIGRLLDGVKFDPAICSIGNIKGTEAAKPGMRVHKHGRTTGLTAGIVAAIDYDAVIGMDHSDSSVLAKFSDQMRIEAGPGNPPFGLGGDSGSLVLSTPGDRAVGLYFAGPQSGSYGIANQIADVLKDLEITLLQA
jgi:hypothetical protein